MISSLTRSKARNRRLRMLLVLLAAVAAAAVVAACSSSGTGTPSSTSSPSGGSTQVAAAAVGLKTAKVGGVTVLTNGNGFTLYTFAPDTSTTSNCNGTCAQNWPPVKGPATASGVSGAFATIKRSDGSTQLTFHGHPLYTFVGDKSPGQASGNGINAFGGLWHEAPASGSAAPASTSSSGGGGSGY
jgi:predicted lipoprotein with Yx(FWY)xxD motif